MKAALLLPLLVACGDNLASSWGIDATFDDHDHSRYFGTVVALGPSATTPVANLSVCIEAACATTSAAGVFVLTGPGAGHEGTLVANDRVHVPTIVPVVGGIAGDRNLPPVLLIPLPVLQQTAAAFGIDPMLASAGGLLVLASHYGQGTIELAIDGHPTSYLDEQQMPDPARTSLANAGGAVFFALPPGEVVLRTTLGRCDAVTDGWAGANPGELRLPVVAGQLTLVHPRCTGG